jgi:hypothetical protein
MLDTIRFRILLVALARWVNGHQLEIIQYLREETACSESSWAGDGFGSRTRSGAVWRRMDIGSVAEC